MTTGHFPASSHSYGDDNSYIVYNLCKLLAAGENVHKPGRIVNKEKWGVENTLLTTKSLTTHFIVPNSEPTTFIPGTHP